MNQLEGIFESIKETRKSDKKIAEELHASELKKMKDFRKEICNDLSFLKNYGYVISITNVGHIQITNQKGYDYEIEIEFTYKYIGDFQYTEYKTDKNNLIFDDNPHMCVNSGKRMALEEIVVYLAKKL